MRPLALYPGAIQGKEGIKFCHLATLQVQSLSEETSSADDGRASSKILTPSNFGSEEEEDDEDTDEDAKGGDCEVISRRKILAANGIDMINNGSNDNLTSSTSGTSASKDSPSTSSGDVSPDAGL